MPTIKNINELRNLSLGLLDDIISEKYKFDHSNDKEDEKRLAAANEQIINTIAISKLELDYTIKNVNCGKKIKFFEYESE